MGFKIESISAWIGVDEDGEEGILGISSHGQMIPLIAADEVRLKDLRPFAEHIQANEPNKHIKLIRFSTRTEVEDLG